MSVAKVGFEHNELELCVKQSKMSDSQLYFSEGLELSACGFKVGVASNWGKRAWKVVLSQLASLPPSSPPPLLSPLA